MSSLPKRPWAPRDGVVGSARLTSVGLDGKFGVQFLGRLGSRPSRLTVHQYQAEQLSASKPCRRLGRCAACRALTAATLSAERWASFMRHQRCSSRRAAFVAALVAQGHSPGGQSNSRQLTPSSHDVRDGGPCQKVAVEGVLLLGVTVRRGNNPKRRVEGCPRKPEPSQWGVGCGRPVGAGSKVRRGSGGAIQGSGSSRPERRYVSLALRSSAPISPV